MWSSSASVPELSPPGPSPPPVPVLLGLGANLGDPEAQLAAAVRRIGEFVDVEVVSSLYRTEPVGIRDQPEFLNLAVAGATTLPVHALHARLQQVEADLGRVRGERNAPRLIDVDLLVFGELALISADLTVPHPRLHERSFVLVPVAEIAPTWCHPTLGASADELLARLHEPSAIRWAGPLRV